MNAISLIRRLAALCLLPLSLHAAPYLPASGNTVVETLSRRDTPRQQELRQLRAQLNAAPQNLQLATSLAQRYLELSRSETDPRYLGYAQAALAPWWNTPAPPTPVRLLRATLLQTTHHFDAALSDLAAVVAAEPNNVQAWLTQATVLTVQGDYPRATASCARVSNLAAPLVAIGCIANVAAATGRLAKAEALLATTLARSDADPELQTWSLTLLAEMAGHRGDAATAQARYLRALKLAPRDSYLLGAYADFLLDQNRPAEVLTLLKGMDRIDALLLRRALALRRLPGMQAELASADAELQARFQAAALRGDSVHQREQARHALHVRADARAALKLAQQNWAVQKESADLRIYLEAALQARDPAAAKPAIEWAERHAVEDIAIQQLLQQLRKRT
ncbi:hypothetical protein HSX11_13760 [Oxalobacteraceae bacterium]|nr:hypothetical protein [Oxalobacteraceae bacterium]